MINYGPRQPLTQRRLFLATLVSVGLLFSNLCLSQTDIHFPDSTKGFFTIPDLKEFSRRLDQTSLGELKRNPEAKEFFGAFVKEIKDRIQKKSKVSLGLTLDELQEIVDGELAIGLIQPQEDLLAIITLAEYKNAELVDKALTKINENLLKAVDEDKKVKLVQKVTVGGHSVNHYEFPDPFGIAGPPQVFYGRTGKYIVSYYGPVLPDTDKKDHVAQVRSLLKSLAGEKAPSLAERETYRATMNRLEAEGKFGKYQSKWFMESFRFLDAAKKIWPDQFSEFDSDTFRNVGFDAIRAAGGILLINDAQREFHIRAFVYAPPVDAKNRFKSAAKMLDFTADRNRLLELPHWINKSASSYLAVHGRMLKAFDNAAPLVDSLYGEDTMKITIENFRSNPKLKANFDLRNELAANLGDRIVAIRDPKFPAKLSHQRVVSAIDIAPNPAGDDKENKTDRRAQVYKVLTGYIANEDPNFIEKIKVKVGNEEVTIFKKIIRQDNDDGGPDELKLDLEDELGDELDDDLEDELGDKPDGAKKPGDEGNGQNQICFAQYGGQVFISPDDEFLKEILQNAEKNKTSGLASEEWFQLINNDLNSLKSSAFESLRYAVRLDLPYKAAFQLIRESKKDLPIEKFLKDLLAEHDEKRLFDLEKLPSDFDRSIGPHLGFIGWSMTTEKDGWMFNGIALRKNAATAKVLNGSSEKKSP